MGSAMPEATKQAPEDLTELPIQELGFSTRLQVLRNSLTRTEQEAGAYFQENPQAVHMSITEVVRDSDLGHGSIIRFCKKMGCSGFQDFKVLFAKEQGTFGQDVAEDSENRFASYGRKIRSEIVNTEKLIDRKAIESVAVALNSANRVLVTGIAGSESTAIGFDYRLSRLGINSSAVCEGYTLAIRAASLTAGDVLLAVSFSGATKDILAAARIAGENAAVVVSVTNFVHAPLVELADFSLFCAAEHDPLSCEIFSNIAGHFVLDVVFSELFRIRKGSREAVEETFRAISDRRV